MMEGQDRREGKVLKESLASMILNWIKLFLETLDSKEILASYLLSCVN